MKSASQMSLMIRRKKKEMQDDPGVIDESGIPRDKQDEDLQDQSELTTELGMDTNHSKMRNEEPTAHQVLMEDSADRAHEAQEPDPKLMHMAEGGELHSGSPTMDRNSGGPLEEPEKQKRMARLMQRMHK